MQFGLAQESQLYIPVNVQKTYVNKTRSFDGKPGSEYWQNSSDYKIKVKVDPESGKISGIENITYSNNSPDTLQQIVIRLYQDYFKKGNTRTWPADPEDVNDGVNIEYIIIDSDTIDFDDDKLYRRKGTNVFVQLNEGLLTDDKVDLEIKWDFSVDRNTKIRMGKYDESSYFIAYWYPQISVYDDIDGWDEFNYGGITESYNDFCSFEVEITVPKNFIVWATGELQNPEELLAEKYLSRYYRSRKEKTIVNIIDSTDLALQDFTKSKPSLTWKFKATRITDFSFALSDHYLWDATCLIVDKDLQKKVLINSAYNKRSKDFYKVAEIAITTLNFLSNELPGIPYPFPQMTVFNGGGGMEFPMMVNDASSATYGYAFYLTSHEITHSYFPFFVGINERKYAWMDESMAVMLPLDFQMKNIQDEDRIEMYANYYSDNAGLELEIPPIIPSQIISYDVYKVSYRLAAYRRPVFANLFLQEILGDSLFKKAIKEFIFRWNGKHPMPNDFFFTFNNVTGEDLSWYWKPWFFDFAYPDLAISNVELNDENVEVSIKNNGNLPLPIQLNILFEDSSTDTLYQTAAIWKNGDKIKRIKLNNSKNIDTIKLGNTHIPDVDLNNNEWNK